MTPVSAPQVTPISMRTNHGSTCGDIEFGPQARRVLRAGHDAGALADRADEPEPAPAPPRV